LVNSFVDINKKRAEGMAVPSTLQSINERMLIKMFKIIRILLCLIFIVNMYSALRCDQKLEITNFITMILVMIIVYIVDRHCELNHIE